MKKLFALFLLSLLLALPAVAQVTAEKKEAQHKATLTIVMINPSDPDKRAGCSATAVAPHVILTAEHCDIENGLLYLNQNTKPFNMGLEVKEKYFDKNDHVLFVVPGVEFKHFVTYDASKVRRATQGEHVYFYGNPDLMMDQYREGYASGVMNFKDSEEEVDAAGPFMMFAVSLVPGDSGSAVFSDKDGQLVGITTWGISDGKFLGSYPLQFTQAQIDQAEGNGNFVYIPNPHPPVVVNVRPQPSTVRIVKNNTFESTLLFILLVCFIVKNFGCAAITALRGFYRFIKTVASLRVSKKT
jgi:hypothetical protein